MKLIALVLAPVFVAPLLVYNAAVSSADRATSDAQAVVVDLTGRWQLDTDLSDTPPQPGEGREPGAGGEGRGRRPGGGGPPGGGGGFPGGMGGGGMRGGGMRGGGQGSRPNPEEMAKMRDAMRAAFDAPAEIIITRKDDEIVFTATGSGDVTRILVTGKKVKTTAGGAEHEIKAAYKDDALLVESSFGPMKVVDTWRISPDRRQLERITKMEGGRRPGGGGGERQIRRVYERVE